MKEIVKSLLTWYQKNKRKLPWRIDKDPYHVWISEIMLQQTRIESVKEYYHRFLKVLPTIESLALVNEDTLLKLWQGLGYYNRAKNLKKAAQIIVSDFHGVFPSTYEQILSLPGIGEYTAGAISSICFSLPVTAIDGNVLRVISRILNSHNNIDDIKTKNMIKKLILNIMPEESGNFNEALMELGETICLPNANPKCGECPLKSYCKARKENTFSLLPIKSEKKEKKIESHTVFLIIYKDKIAIEKRSTTGLLSNLWQIPNIEQSLSPQQIKEYFTKKQLIEVKKITYLFEYQHIFTHKIWQNKVYNLKLNKPLPYYTWATLKQIKEIYAIPTAFEPIIKWLENYKDI